tara:strand:+ start:4062 stop:4700 length:639 start_codon:yes stop_codon:yes gene_type:complete
MIHCIGNSHVSMFSNQEKLTLNFRNEYFSACHLGPIIAYNFTDKHLPRTLDYFRNNVDKENDIICFVVGEVDCRLHIPLQSDNQKRNDLDVVKECVGRFFESYKILKRQGFKCFSLCTHPTTSQDHDMSNLDSPVYGSPQRRNDICVMWNEELERLSNELGIPYKTIYNKLVNPDNTTIMDYFLDYCHLDSKKVYGFILDELGDIINDSNLT